MKNKKLFAILTLVCFMFTLMPVAAFAATDYKAGQVYVKEAGEWVVAGEQTMTVSAGIASATVEVGYSKTGTTPSATDYIFFAEDENGNGVTYGNPGDISLTFDAAGVYTIYAVATKDASGAAVLDNTWDDEYKALDTVAKKVADLKAWAKAEKKLGQKTATVEVEYAEYDYSIVVKKGDTVLPDTNGDGVYELGIKANNGWTGEGELTAYLTAVDAPYSAIAGKALTFTTAGYASVELEDGNYTSAAGAVDFEVVSERAGVYNVTVSYGKLASAKIKVTVSTANLVNVVVNDSPKTPVNVDEEVELADVEFKFTDANGAPYALNANDKAAQGAGDVKVTLTEKPADSKLKSEDFALTNDSDDAAGVYTLTRTAGDKEFDKEGDYTFTITLVNGATAKATVTAAEQGEVVGIKLVGTPATIIYGGTANVASAVRTIDAAGVTATIANWKNVVDFSVAGKAIETLADVVPECGCGDDADCETPECVDDILNINVKDDEDYVGSIITLYATYGDFVASAEITVVDMAADIVYAATTGDVAVTNKLSARVLDAAGKVVALPGTPVVKTIVLDKPANAVAVADATYNVKTGVTMNLLASEIGEYKVQTIITYNDGVERYISSIDTFTLGAEAGLFNDVVVVSIGADVIVVNSDVVAIPAAAVIKDSRTFVPLRAVAEAFGAEVEWTPEAITAELNGVKVVMNAGEKAYTVNGAAKVADVAPYLNAEAATTMVPVSFIAQAFGINYQCIFAADGTVADVLFTK